MIISAHTPRTPLLALCHTLLLALLVCTLILPYPIAAAAAEITPDPAAPAGNRPSMDAASNGVPVVNIVAPVSSGLSHNMFLDFNVGTPGVIINNSNTPGISQLGGGVMGNPNFSGTQASTILNEVTSNRPSSINGFTEIFGGKADYILANPNGVSINGGGFINTSRAVITTGTPQIAGGTLNSIEVRRGTVAVEGDGLNAQGADSFTILSRAATVAADLHAGQLNIIAGRNSYAPATQTATPLAEDPADGPAPVIAVDSSVLGGMYADRIVLVANEKGVGVNLQGAVNADHMTLHADGRLTFRQVQADTAADITAGSVDIAAGSTLVSRKDITVRADTIENAGLTYSGGSTTLLADSSLINRAGSIVAKGDLTLGDALTTAPGTVNVAITNEGGLVQSLEGNVGITAGTFLNKIALIDIQKKLLSTHYVPRFDGKDAVISYIGRTWGSRPGNARGLTETTYKYEEFVAEKSPTPQVLAGGNMVVDAAVITNDHGLIAAKKDMELRGGSLQNKGSSVSFIEHTDRTYYIYKAGSGGGSPSYATHDEYEAISSVPAVIAAGGTLSGDFTARIDNDTIKHNADYEGVVSSSDGPELPPGEAGGRVDTAVAGVGSLFTKATAPGRQYVLETNPLISSMGTFFGSEYFLSRMGWDLDAHHQKLLGDAFFETQMVRQQLAELNARSLTASFDQPDADMMIALMENALAAGTSLSLTVGIELTHEQLAALDKDIVWLVEQEYEGQTVLVPKVYLADASRATVVGNGARIAAKDVRLQTANLSSSGDITGTDVRITADEVQNLGGKLEGAALLVDASGIILNRSGAILGNDVTLKAGADVISETSKRTETFRAGSAEQLNQAATIAASDSLSIQAGNNIRIHAGQLAAGGDATLAAGKDVEIGAVGLGETLHTEEWQMQRVRQKGSNVAVGGDLTVAAGRDVNVLGSAISTGGDMAVVAGEHVNIASVQDVYDSKTESKSKGLFSGSSSSKKTEHYVENTRSVLTSGGKLDISAGTSGGGDLAVIGSTLISAGDVNLTAQDAVVLAPSINEMESTKKDVRSGMLTGKSGSEGQHSKTTINRSEVSSGGDINITSNDSSVMLKAAKLESEGTITLRADEGSVLFLTEKETSFDNETKYGSSIVWQTIKNKGESHEEVKHTEIFSKNGVKVIAGQGIVVEYRDTGSLTDSLDQLQDKPGLEWMQTLRNDPNVNWHAIAEAHDSWSSSYEGLTGAGTAIIALAVAVATYGVGSSLAGVSGTAAAGETVAVSKVVAAAAADAAFTSLCAQAAISLANNKGDLGGVFKDLISERAVRSLATSILTAAIIAGVDATFFKPEMADAADKATTIGDHISNVVADLPGAIQQGVVHGTISGAVDTAINGGDLGQNLLGSIQGAVVAEIGASAATEIGAAYHNGNINKAAQYIAHAALGGAMDLALGGDGASGAVGAVVGEAVGEMLYSSKEAEVTDFAKRVIEGRTDQLQRDQMAQSLQKFKADGVNISALVSGIAAALLGKDVNIASMTGANAAENNALATIAALLCVVFAAYATVEGGGDVVAGIRRIGAGDDTASKLVESGLLAAGELAYEVAPEQTEWVIGQLSVLGAGADAIVTYVDDKTGNTVSAYWSSLSEDDRNLIKGLGVGASFVVGNANCGSLFQKVGSKFASSKALTTASKLEDAAEALGEVQRVEKIAEKAQQAAVVAGAKQSFGLIFKGDSAVSHFEKHAKQTMDAFGHVSYNIKQYILDANHVVQSGKYVPELNGYVKLVGGPGAAKYAFVGVDRAGKSITTFHIKSIKELAKKAPSLGINQ